MKLTNFAICSNNRISDSVQICNTLYNILYDKNINSDILDIDNLKSGYDFVFVIGGDGTILKAARFYAKYGTPIFGINLGRLGFLSQSSKENIEKSVGEIIKGKFVIEDRIMLQSGHHIALNDFVIKGCDFGRTTKFSLKINDKYVCDYLADGIIISTPTGSTAYGLSAGGPVLSPNLDVFGIIPICPHTLTARPIIIPACEKITICVEENNKCILSTDGQELYEFDSEITVKKSDFNAKLALLDNSEFYSILRNKLHWSVPPAYTN